jgi:predicted nucleic acid-binding protein
VLVLDSSFVIAFHNRRDVNHAAAADGMRRLLSGEWGRALLLEYVFLEVVTVLRARLGLATALHVGDALLHAREVDFLPCSDVFAATLETFRRQRTSALSFTDAAIVTVARENAPALVASFDSDFRRLGDLAVVPTAGG